MTLPDLTHQCDVTGSNYSTNQGILLSPSDEDLAPHYSNIVTRIALCELGTRIALCELGTSFIIYYIY